MQVIKSRCAFRRSCATHAQAARWRAPPTVFPREPHGSRTATTTHRTPAQRGSFSGIDVEQIQMRALDTAVGLVNRILGRVESELRKQPPAEKLGSAATPELPDDGASQVVPQVVDAAEEPVWINLRADTSFYRQVEEVPGRGLDRYLGLPTSEYSLLNSKHVAFLGDNTFSVTFPFRESFGLDLEPEILLQVKPDLENARVTFVSKKVSSGREDVDKVTNIHFASILSREDTDGGSEVYLVSVIQFKASLRLTPEASRIVPAQMLETLGNRILQMTMKMSLDPYMKSLERDYYSWAASQPRALLAGASDS